MRKSRILLAVLLAIVVLGSVVACTQIKTVRIEMENLPKSFYLEGEVLDVSGGTIAVVDSHGNRRSVSLTNDMISGFKSTESGRITLTVSFEGLQTEFSILILPEVENISVSETVSTEYYYGDDITDDSVKLLAKTDLGDEIIDLKREQFSQLDTSTVGEKTAEINLYNIYTFVFNYTVKYKVEFVTNTADGESVMVGTIGAVHEPDFARRDGYNLEGWYDGDIRFDFSREVEGNKVLKAKWSLIYDIHALNGTTIEVVTAASDLVFEYNGDIITTSYDNGKYAINIGRMTPNTSYRLNFLSAAFSHSVEYTYLGREVRNLQELTTALTEAQPGDSIVIKADLVLDAGTALTIKDNVFLFIDESVTFRNNGQIINYGSISGTVEGIQPEERENIPSDDYN